MCFSVDEEWQHLYGTLSMAVYFPHILLIRIVPSLAKLIVLEAYHHLDQKLFC